VNYINFHGLYPSTDDLTVLAGDATLPEIKEKSHA